MILVYSEKNTSRLKYTLDLIFGEVMAIRYLLTDDFDLFLQSTAIRINYSEKRIEKVLHISPSGLLHEKGIQEQSINMGTWHNIPVLFANNSPDLTFDFFSAVFYLVTRYEEYLNFEPDRHGRFEATQSLAWKNNFLDLPVVDLWCKYLADELGILKECKGVHPSNYRFQLTIDIDQARNGLFHIAGRMIKRLLKFDFPGVNQQIRILLRLSKDPADTFDYLEDIRQRLSEEIKFFILFGKRGKYDINNSTKDKKFQNLIIRLTSKNIVGIHPSYASNASFNLLETEHKKLSDVVHKKIIISRQHFLKLKMPETYRNLIKIGIEEDYTMGYGTQNGFRAGIARPFYFFDLQNETATKLRVFPFQAMDRTLLTYLKYTPAKAILEFKYYSKTIEEVGGLFIPLWHNTSLGDEGEWKGWKVVFEEMINLNKLP